MFLVSFSFTKAQSIPAQANTKNNERRVSSVKIDLRSSRKLRTKSGPICSINIRSLFPVKSNNIDLNSKNTNANPPATIVLFLRASNTSSLECF